MITLRRAFQVRSRCTRSWKKERLKQATKPYHNYNSRDMRVSSKIYLLSKTHPPSYICLGFCGLLMSTCPVIAHYLGNIVWSLTGREFGLNVLFWMCHCRVLSNTKYVGFKIYCVLQRYMHTILFNDNTIAHIVLLIIF